MVLQPRLCSLFMERETLYFLLCWTHREPQGLPSSQGHCSLRNTASPSKVPMILAGGSQRALGQVWRSKDPVL
jgi:hypothetical protein